MPTELSAIPEQTKQRLDQIGAVDLVIGLLDPQAGGKIPPIVGEIRRGLAGVSSSARAVLVHHPVAASSAAAEVHEDLEDETLRLISYSLPSFDPSIPAAQSIANAYRTIWSMSEKLAARACIVVASSIETVTSEWIYGLAQPLLDREFDLVAPCYAPQKFEALLNSAILYPLTRAVYGKQIHNPLGPDFGFSARLFQNFLQMDPAKGRGVTPNQLMLIGPVAVVRGFKVCQAHLGRRTYPPVDWKNLDSVIASVLGPLFLDVEKDAPFWQHIRSSEAVPTFGDCLASTEDNVAFDLRRVLEPFHLGFRNLKEIWGLFLPPSGLLELGKVNQLPPEQFRIPDELWARIMYDFALAHRLRTIGRDHLLRAMTPLYFGWVASYALEVETLEASAVEKRLARLYAAYEKEKSYLVSRWRWPDRFNP